MKVENIMTYTKAAIKIQPFITMELLLRIKMDF